MKDQTALAPALGDFYSQAELLALVALGGYYYVLLLSSSPNIPRHAPVRNARPRPLAAGGLASLEPRRRFRRHPPQRALPVAECGALYAAPVFGGGPGFSPSPS